MPRRQKIKVSKGGSWVSYFGLRGRGFATFKETKTGITVRTFGLTRLTPDLKRGKTKTKIARGKK
tara:strand:- start:3000 stop:3194 length:195 start_codon:yes stop_codon:yes gene_type:complete